jgi:hypothetical protein
MFVFWMIWPYIMTRVSQVIFFKFTGRIMPKDAAKKLRGELAGITRPITKPVSPEGTKRPR